MQVNVFVVVFSMHYVCTTETDDLDEQRIAFVVVSILTDERALCSVVCDNFV